MVNWSISTSIKKNPGIYRDSFYSLNNIFITINTSNSNNANNISPTTIKINNNKISNIISPFRLRYYIRYPYLYTKC